MRHFAVSFLILFCTSGLAQTVYPGEPPAPPLENLMAKESVRKKVETLETSCHSRLAKKTCGCVVRNFKLKLNGRDINESELDMFIDISGRKNLKKWKATEGYDQSFDMMNEIESQCTIDENWIMDLE